MHPITTDITELRRWIGRRVRHTGQLCVIIEVLEDGPALILGEIGGCTIIQSDQFGEARRRVHPTHTISIYAGDGLTLNPDFADLEFVDDHTA